MARVLHDNRTVTFGPDESLKITEWDLADAIMERVGSSREDAMDLVAELIDAFEGE